jgi:hypothetical protein
LGLAKKGKIMRTKRRKSSSQILLMIALLVGGPITAHAVCPPTIGISVSATPTVLWPPNHKFVMVDTTVTVTDGGCGPTTVALLSVSSNEPSDGTGDGSTSDDIVIVDDYTFELRAERSGSGSGRTYTICYIATDTAGSQAQECAVVSVPLNQLF